MRSRLLTSALAVFVVLVVVVGCAPSAGGSWVAVPPPVTAGESGLTSVSCVTATWCLATGSTTDEAGTRPLVQLWSGTAWASGPAFPDAFADADIRTVMCPAVGQCVAVGLRATSNRPAFLARLSGTRWTDESAGLPDPVTNEDLEGVYFLTDVWCGTGTCIAVGPGWNSDNVALISTGGAWTKLPTPPGYQGAQMPGRVALQIDCATPKSCGVVAAAATYMMTSTASYWNGTSWTDPMVTGGWLENVGLLGVDCPSVGTFFATGVAQATEDEPAPPGLIATFDGSTWKVGQRLANALGPISCASADRCIVARNNLFDPSGLDGMVRDRGRWSPVRAPVPAIPEGGRVGDVSCVPRGDVCLAVGSAPYGPQPGAFAYRWRF